jgi:transcriptional regulator with XRE-family HTH domain
MGYRGKVQEREQARDLREHAWTLQEIATELGVSRSSVSVWVRDVEFEPKPRRRTARRRSPNKLQIAKQAEVDEMLAWGSERLGQLSEDAFLAAGAALYAGEGSKTDGAVLFANSDARMISFFCAWFRRFFDIDESRLRLKLYLHQGLDLEAAIQFWTGLTGIPRAQMVKPYRAVPDPTIRSTKHVYGCAYVGYSSARVHRAVMGLTAALLALPLEVDPG